MTYIKYFSFYFCLIYNIFKINKSVLFKKKKKIFLYDHNINNIFLIIIDNK